MADNDNVRTREDEFLLQEHREIWEFVRKITDLEAGWLKFYYTIVAASLAALGVLYKYAPDLFPGNERFKLWIIATAILFILGIVSITVLRNSLVLRERSVEYRNHLNIIRPWFLKKADTSNFVGFLDKEKWNYLSRKPDQKFSKRGVEMTGFYLLTAISSLILGAFAFSLLRLIHLSIRALCNAQDCCSMIIFLWIFSLSIIVSLIIWGFLICWVHYHGKKYDKKHIEKNKTPEDT